MQNHIHKIRENPVLPFITAAVQCSELPPRAHFGDLIGNGAHLPGAGAGGEHEIIRDLRQASKIKDGYVLAMGVGGQAGGVDGELPGFIGLRRFSGLR